MHETDRKPRLDDRTGGFWGILDGGERLRTLLLLASGAFLLFMLGSLIVPLLLAAILAAITWPVRDLLVRWFRGRVVLASAVLLVTLVAGIVLPVGLVVFLAVIQVRDLSKSLHPDAMIAWAMKALDKIGHLPFLDRLGIESGELLQRLQASIPEGATFVLSSAAQISLGFAQSAAMLALMLLCLFYLHLSGDKLVDKVQRLLPLPEGETAAMLDVFRRTSLAILKGNFVIAAIQGTLTGLLFAAVGLPSSIFFAVVAALCSLIPSIGSALVWLPAGLILGLSGSWGLAWVVILVGALVISTVDNLLRPILVGRDTGMHDLMVLLTTLGGLSFFGPLGLLFGPLVGAAFLALLERHEADLTSGGDPEGLQEDTDPSPGT